jgi:hypothetical protein
MTRLERIRQDSHGLGESKAITSEVYTPLASEPIGLWPTGRNRLVLYCRLLILNNHHLILYCSTIRYEYRHTSGAN